MLSPIADSAGGILRLLQALTKFDTPQRKFDGIFAAIEPFDLTFDRIQDVQISLRDRFPSNAADGQTILFTAEDLKQFERAVRPVCSFVNALFDHDLSSEGAVMHAIMAGCALTDWAEHVQEIFERRLAAAAEPAAEGATR